YCSFGEPEDKPFVGYTDQEEMAQYLMVEHGVDAVEGLAGIVDYLQKYKELVDKYMFEKPVPINKLIAEAQDAKTREILMTTYYGSAMDIIRKFFPDPEKHRCIVGSLCASAIDGTHTGPFTAGSAFSMAYHYTMGNDYDFRTPRGGIGGLSEALVRSFEDHGGKIQYKSPVERILIENGVAAGVELKTGEKITSKVVLSSLDAQASFLGLVSEEQLPSDFTHAVKEIKYENGYIQIQMTLNELYRTSCLCQREQYPQCNGLYSLC
ncbi:MAG: hypothetical protein GY850_34455, partial [bacterium]|nr:hypothetical protein [bacterium]